MIHGVVPVVLFTIAAVANVRPELIKTRVLVFGAFDMVTQVPFPAVLPAIFSGLRIGFALALIGTLLGEIPRREKRPRISAGPKFRVSTYEKNILAESSLLVVVNWPHFARNLGTPGFARASMRKASAVGEVG